MSKKKQKRKGKKKKILEGHKKVGARFIPPMKQLSNMKSTSFVNQMLPELIWAGLINDNIGYIRGARLFEKIFPAIEDVIPEDIKGNFAYISSFKMLNESDKTKLVDKFTELEIINELRKYLEPLIVLYDEFPLAFIGSPEEITSRDQLIQSMSNCVARHVDKYDTPGIVLNGISLLSRLVTGKIYFSKDIDIPDFDSVINSPTSDEAKHAAGFMRSNAIGEFGMLEINDSWARYFWNRGFELSGCEFFTEEEISE